MSFCSFVRARVERVLRDAECLEGLDLRPLAFSLGGDLRFLRRGDDGGVGRKPILGLGLGGKGILGGGPGDGGIGEPKDLLDGVGDGGIGSVCIGKSPRCGRGTVERSEMGDQSEYGVIDMVVGGAERSAGSIAGKTNGRITS